MSRHVPDALRVLASLLRSGLTLRQAIEGWPRRCDATVRDELALLSRRIALGVSLVDAASSTSFGWILRPAFALHLSGGFDLASWLEASADMIEERDRAGDAARAASAGAVLSGRMVAGLPLLFVPLTSMSKATLWDPAGFAMLLVGIALSVAGLRWIGQLVPSPPEEDRIALFCRCVAALMRCGLGVSAAVDLVAKHGLEGLEDELTKARRLHQLGLSWPKALSGADPSLETVGLQLEISQRLGLPVVDQLEELARACTEARKRSFQERMRRAPVLMVVPLTCCILPAYGLLALGPFLRSIGMG